MPHSVRHTVLCSACSRNPTRIQCSIHHSGLLQSHHKLQHSSQGNPFHSLLQKIQESSLACSGPCCCTAYQRSSQGIFRMSRLCLPGRDTVSQDTPLAALFACRPLPGILLEVPVRRKCPTIQVCPM